MTRKEAESIRDLQIPIDNLTEDCFYMFMAEKGRIPEENKKKSLLRIKTYTQEIPFEVLSKAKKWLITSTNMEYPAQNGVRTKLL